MELQEPDGSDRLPFVASAKFHIRTTTDEKAVTHIFLFQLYLICQQSSRFTISLRRRSQLFSMWYSDSEHNEEKKKLLRFSICPKLVWRRLRRSTSCPSIHPCLTCLSCCVRENTHGNYGHIYNLNQWFSSNLEDCFLQSCPVGKVDWDFPDLKKTLSFFFILLT